MERGDIFREAFGMRGVDAGSFKAEGPALEEADRADFGVGLVGGAFLTGCFGFGGSFEAVAYVRILQLRFEYRIRLTRR